MNADAILHLLGPESKIRAFKSCLEKLETAPPLDLEALRVCIKLRPSVHATATTGVPEDSTQPGNILLACPSQDQSSASARLAETQTLNARLCDLLLARIPLEQLDSNHFFKLAEIVCSDGSFANLLFRQNMYKILAALQLDLSARTHDDAHDHHEPESNIRHAVRTATSYLTLLKCSYWLPINHNHVIDQGSLKLLSAFVGLATTDEIAHDAISALLSLLRQRGPIVVASTTKDTDPWLRLDPSSGQLVLSGSILDSSLWDRFSTVELRNHTAGESSTCREHLSYLYMPLILAHALLETSQSTVQHSFLTSRQVSKVASLSGHGFSGSLRP
jgi:tRNA guanosine-2'-O-methyltransferase